jgi:hypothetical protein
MSETETETFRHSQEFAPGEVGGNRRLGKLESMYEELFAEVIEDGVITQEERNQLDKMADNLGLDRARLRRLETALQAAYEARNRIVIKDLSFVDEPPPATIMPFEQANDVRTLALERRIKSLEARIVELERDLEEAKAHINVEVDFSDVSAASPAAVPDEDDRIGVEVCQRAGHVPRAEEGNERLETRRDAGQGAVEHQHVARFEGQLP